MGGPVESRICQACRGDYPLSPITDFITELIRAANEVGNLSALKKVRMLQRSIVIIRNGRDQVGIPPSKSATDALIHLQTVAASIDRRSNDEVKAALLDAADMIRTLKIVLDAKDEVLRGD
jgi:hypothetical protein